MKKALSVILTVAMLFSLAACGETQTSSAGDRTSTQKSVDDVLNDLTAPGGEPLDTPAPTATPETTAPIETAASSATPGTEPTPEPTENPSGDRIDVDLTVLSSTMVYSEVYNMMSVPKDYIGKTVKMKGTFVVGTNADQTQYYPAVLIADATACCSQGIEFVWSGHTYPTGYPEVGTEIVVIGEFQTYQEDGYTYCHLVDAEIV